MAYHMSYDEIKYEQESQRGGYDDDPYAIGPGPDLYRPDSAYASTGGGGGSTRGKCLHCEQPGHQWRVCQWRCNHCGTFEHAHIPKNRASTQCPALLHKKPRIYEQHNYRHTTDRGNAVGSAESVRATLHSFLEMALTLSHGFQVAELSHVLERFMQGLRRENEGLRDDLIRTQRHADLLERDLRETRERFWEERETRAQVEVELKDEDTMREEVQQDHAAPTPDRPATPTGPGMHSDRLRRLQAQRQRRSRRYQSDAQRRMNEQAGFHTGGHRFGGPRPY